MAEFAESPHRTPSKVRAKRENLSKLFPDDIPVRDTTGDSVCTDASFQDAKPKSPTSIRRPNSTTKSVFRRRSSLSPAKSTDTIQIRADSESQDSRRCNSMSIMDSAGSPEQKKLSVKKVKKITSNIEKNETSNAVTLSRNIYNLWQNEQLCDVVFNAGGRTFHAHKLVMVATCGMFSPDIAKSTDNEILQYDIPSAQAEAMEDVLKYFYLSKLNVSVQNVDSLIRIGKHLGISKIVDMCKVFLCKFDNNTMLYNRYISKCHNLRDVTYKMNSYIWQNFAEVLRSPCFLQSDFQIMHEFLASGDFDTVGQLKLFNGIVAWVDFNRQSRLCYVEQLLEKVKLCDISPGDLVTCVECHDHIFSIPECRAMLYSAFKFHSLSATGVSKVNPMKSISDQLEYSTMSIPESPAESAEERTSDSDCREHECLVVEVGETTTETVEETTEDNDEEITLDIRPPGTPNILVFGGLNSFGTGRANVDVSQTIQKYDMIRNSWNVLSEMPVALHHFGVAMLNGKVIVTGGSSSCYSDEDVPMVTNSCYKYDTGTNAWSVMAALNISRMKHATLCVHNVVYVIGGQDDEGNALDSMEFYISGEDRWYIGQPMIYSRIAPSAAKVNDEIYVVGGIQGQFDGVVLDTTESFNPTNNAWTLRPPLPNPICHSAFTDVNGVLYLIGGYADCDGNRPLSQNEIMRFRYETDTWDVFHHLHVPRHSCSAVVQGSRIYVLGGMSSAAMDRPLASVECVDVDTEDHVDDIEPLMGPASGLASCVFSDYTSTNGRI